MVRHLEAVFEGGVLRPLQPLQLTEFQHVMVTIDDSLAVDATEFDHRQAEHFWMREHGHEYIGQWMAVDGGTLIAHAPNAVAVRDEARRQRLERPFVVRVPLDFGTPSAGWL